MEIWSQIEDFDDYYVSNCGNIYSKKSNKVLSPWFDGKHRYLQVCLCKNGKNKKVSVHTLVAKAFIPNLDNKLEVNHKDYDTTNNNVDNLEWVTRKENMQHCFELYTPVRNYKECILYKGNKMIGEFKSINEACRYARDNYNASYSMLNKHRKYKGLIILPKTQTTISQESTPDDKLLVEVPTTLAS